MAKKKPAKKRTKKKALPLKKIPITEEERIITLIRLSERNIKGDDRTSALFREQAERLKKDLYAIRK